DRQDIRHGVLAVRGVVDLLSGLCLAGRTAPDRGMGAVDGPDARRVHAAGPDHHLPAGMAAGMDGDHCYLHADFRAGARQLRYRPAVLWPAGGSEPANRLPVEIGRASCRERVKTADVAVTWKKNDSDPRCSAAAA